MVLTDADRFFTTVKGNKKFKVLYAKKATSEFKKGDQCFSATKVSDEGDGIFECQTYTLLQITRKNTYWAYSNGEPCGNLALDRLVCYNI
jgi:hypothetical protein